MKSVELNISKKNNTEKGEWEPNEIFSKLNFTGQETEKGKRKWIAIFYLNLNLNLNLQIFNLSIFNFQFSTSASKIYNFFLFHFCYLLNNAMHCLYL